MSIIVSNCQHCDEQQFQTLSCVHYMIFSAVKLDLFIQTLLLDRILALEKLRVRLVYILFSNITRVLIGHVMPRPKVRVTDNSKDTVFFTKLG